MMFPVFFYKFFLQQKNKNKKNILDKIKHYYFNNKSTLLAIILVNS